MTDFVDQHRVVNFSIAIILFILAFIIPAAIIYPLKPSFITLEAQEIGTTHWSLITGAVGILALASIFLVFAIMEKKVRKIVLIFAFGLLAFIGTYLSVKDYYYVTPNYFASNGPFSFETKIYEWDDFESVEEILVKKDGTTLVEIVVLHMKDGSQIEYKGGAMLSMSRTIISKVQDAGGRHMRTKPK